MTTRLMMMRGWCRRQKTAPAGGGSSCGGVTVQVLASSLGSRCGFESRMQTRFRFSFGSDLVRVSRHGRSRSTQFNQRN
ncbi:hypothetical protein HanRHA438_Chr10g0435051 [Helianthus annuus]|nr:hypothetical protein HanRHA438_Chr10g0435051 [Helianthus annuus]KAJ0882323.1 hypothetical protein HanPSC8_Chr10g0408321 [Helianthus annuus]